MLLGEDSGSKVCGEGEAPNPSVKFLRDSDVAENIFFCPPPNRQGHKAVRKMDELLSIDRWHKPPRALAGPKSTSVIRSSHHLEEKRKKKRRHDFKVLQELYFSCTLEKRKGCHVY